MRSMVVGWVVVSAMGLAGCAVSHPVDDYRDMPGSGDRMSEGPGLFAGSQADSYDGGFTIYSDDPDQEAVFNPNRPANRPADTAAPRSDGAQARDAGFREFQEYQRYQNMPKDSPEYRKFQQWLEWQRYQEWESQRQQ